MGKERGRRKDGRGEDRLAEERALELRRRRVLEDYELRAELGLLEFRVGRTKDGQAAIAVWP